MKPPPLAHPLVISAAALALAACSSGPGRIVEGPKYPADTVRAATLDIQVFRRQTEIELTNTTAQVFGPSTLWINGWFSKKIDGLALGQTLRLPLRDFKDRYGESFRAGGFFATELPERLALAEIQEGKRMMGLVVVGGE